MKKILQCWIQGERGIEMAEVEAESILVDWAIKEAKEMMDEVKKSGGTRRVSGGVDLIFGKYLKAEQDTWADGDEGKESEIDEKDWYLWYDGHHATTPEEIAYFLIQEFELRDMTEEEAKEFLK